MQWSVISDSISGIPFFAAAQIQDKRGTRWSQCHTHSAICDASICRTVVPELVKAALCWTWCIPYGSGSDSCAVIVWWSSTGSNKISEGVLIGLHVDYWCIAHTFTAGATNSYLTIVGRHCFLLASLKPSLYYLDATCVNILASDSILEQVRGKPTCMLLTKLT